MMSLPADNLTSADRSMILPTCLHVGLGTLAYALEGGSFGRIPLIPSAGDVRIQAFVHEGRPFRIDSRLPPDAVTKLTNLSEEWLHQHGLDPSTSGAVQLWSSGWSGDERRYFGECLAAVLIALARAHGIPMHPARLSRRLAGSGDPAPSWLAGELVVWNEGGSYVSLGPMPAMIAVAWRRRHDDGADSRSLLQMHAASFHRATKMVFPDPATGFGEAAPQVQNLLDAGRETLRSLTGIFGDEERRLILSAADRQGIGAFAGAGEAWAGFLLSPDVAPERLGHLSGIARLLGAVPRICLLGVTR